MFAHGCVCVCVCFVFYPYPRSLYNYIVYVWAMRYWRFVCKILFKHFFFRSFFFWMKRHFESLNIIKGNEKRMIMFFKYEFEKKKKKIFPDIIRREKNSLGILPPIWWFFNFIQNGVLDVQLVADFIPYIHSFFFSMYRMA